MMASTKSKRNIVLFLGAGFSAHAGLPVMCAFGCASRKELKPYKGRQPGWRKDQGRFHEAGKMFSRFQEYCESATDVVRMDPDNMEDVFCVVESLLESGEKTVQLDGRPYELEDIRTQISTWLWKIYHKCPPLAKRKDRHMGVPYQRLAGLLKEHDGGRGISVLTTNYDIVLEHYCWEQGVPCSYDLTNAASLRVGTGPRSYLIDDSSESAPLVCKLHGSVNFFIGSSIPNGKDFGVATDVSEGKRIGMSAIPRNRPTLTAYDAVWQLRENYGQSLDPTIVAPTYGKFLQYKWLKEIWHNAANALRQADMLVFIGYSMPESDGHMRAMIQAAMAHRATGDAPKVHVFDVCEGTLERYRQFFGPLQLQRDEHLWKMSFAEAVEGQLSEVLAD
jgi:SIR2-like protein